MCYAYFESHVQAKVDQQDLYILLQDLQMRTIHEFESIQRKQVRKPSVSSVECKKLEHGFADEQGDASIGFRSKEDGVVLNMHAPRP